MTADEFEQEALRLRPMLISIALRYVGDMTDAEDIVQDVLLKLWAMGEKLCLPADHLATILTRNISIDCVRRKPTIVTLSNETIPDILPGDKERIERMMAIIDKMPAMQQTILRLRHMEGMKLADIAQLIGTNEVALRKSLSRARKNIKAEYLKIYNANG